MPQPGPDLQQSEEPNSRAGSEWTSLRWPATLIVLAIIVLAAYVFTLRLTRDSLKSASQELSEIASGLRTGTITTEFLASLPRITSVSGGELSVSEARVVETLSRKDEKRILWDYISLGETVTEIKVPVTYRYHVRLNDPWELDISGSTCTVRAPALRPTLPPAIHTDQIQKHIDRGWARFDSDFQMETLEKSITPTLERYASDPLHLDLVREKSRRSVAEFVQTWLLSKGHWKDDQINSIVVLFADEEGSGPAILRPALELAK